MMWLLAESWGQVTSAGTTLPLTLTHDTLGGLVGALIFVFAYFLGIALVGAGLGALVAHVGWPLARKFMLIVAFCVIAISSGVALTNAPTAVRIPSDGS